MTREFRPLAVEPLVADHRVVVREVTNVSFVAGLYVIDRGWYSLPPRLSKIDIVSGFFTARDYDFIFRGTAFLHSFTIPRSVRSRLFLRVMISACSAA